MGSRGLRHARAVVDVRVAGDVEPLVALAVRLRELGAEVTVCAPPDDDFVARLAGVGVPLIGVGPSARAMTKAAPPPSSGAMVAAKLLLS